MGYLGKAARQIKPYNLADGRQGVKRV